MTQIDCHPVMITCSGYFHPFIKENMLELEFCLEKIILSEDSGCRSIRRLAGGLELFMIVV